MSETTNGYFFLDNELYELYEAFFLDSFFLSLGASEACRNVIRIIRIIRC